MAKLIKFPLMKESLNQYRIEQALKSISEENEFNNIDQILVGLYNFFSEVEESELILHDIHRLRATIEEYYE